METITTMLTFRAVELEDGIHLISGTDIDCGILSKESSEFITNGMQVSEADIRWRSRRSGFIILDRNSPRLKDFGRFWVDVKNPETKHFE